MELKPIECIAVNIDASLLRNGIGLFYKGKFIAIHLLKLCRKKIDNT